MLRRAVPVAVEFVTLTLFESLEAIRGFAGEEADKALIEPRAAELLAEYDERARHFEVVEAPVRRSQAHRRSGSR